MVANLPNGTGDDEQDQDGTPNTRYGNSTTASSRIPRPRPNGKSKRPSATSESDIVEDMEGCHHAVCNQKRDE